MDAQPECQVPVRFTRQVERVRIRKLLLVTIRGCNHGKDHLTTRNRSPHNRHVPIRKPLGGRRQRAVKTQQLLNRGPNQPRIAAKLFQRARILEQRKRPFPIRFTVVSWPAINSRKIMDTSSDRSGWSCIGLQLHGVVRVLVIARDGQFSGPRGKGVGAGTGHHGELVVV